MTNQELLDSYTAWLTLSVGAWITEHPTETILNLNSWTADSSANTTYGAAIHTQQGSDYNFSKITGKGVSHIEPSSISVPAEASTGTVTVTANEAWTATSDSLWLTVTGSTATSFDYAVEANPDTVTRQASIFVGGPTGATQVFNLNQAPVVPGRSGARR